MSSSRRVKRVEHGARALRLAEIWLEVLSAASKRCWEGGCPHLPAFPLFAVLQGRWKKLCCLFQRFPWSTRSSFAAAGKHAASTVPPSDHTWLQQSLWAFWVSFRGAHQMMQLAVILALLTLKYHSRLSGEPCSVLSAGREAWEPQDLCQCVWCAQLYMSYSAEDAPLWRHPPGEVWQDFQQALLLGSLGWFFFFFWVYGVFRGGFNVHSSI